MSSSTGLFLPDQLYRSNDYSPFPIGWVILITAIIVMIIIILYFSLRQRTQLIEPINCPSIKSRYAVQPGITKTVLRSCGSTQSEECLFPASTLSKAIQICDSNSTFCTEFSYDPITQTARIVDPSGARQSTQQENLYLRQVGTIIVTSS
jgi:hypothetical protein